MSELNNDPFLAATTNVNPPEKPIPIGSIVKEGEADIHENTSVKVYEDKKSGKKQMVVKLIEEGLSKNGYYYSKSVAESIADFMTERPQMYMDHSMSLFGGGARSFNELVAVATESYKKDGAAYAIVEMVDNPQTSWLYELAKAHEGVVGASIDARAKVREAKTEDGMLWGEENFDPAKAPRPRFVVESFHFLNSVDFVTYPSAGGQVVELMASQITNEATRKLTSLMEGFKREVSNLIKEDTEESNMANSEVKVTTESLKADYPELYEQIQEQAVANATKDSETESQISELETAKKELEDRLEEASKANDDLRTRLDEFETKEKVESTKKKVNDLIAEHGLEKNFISEVFVEDLMKLDDDEAIVSRIKDRKSLVEKTSGEVTGNGQRQAKESAEEEKEQDPVSEEVSDEDLVKSIKSYTTNRR